MAGQRVSWQNLKNVFFFFASGFIVALGQPDRGILFPLLSYAIGYSTFFYLLKQRETKKERIKIAFFWSFGVNLFQLSWLSTTYYHGIGIFFVYLIVVCLFALPFALLFGWGLSKRISLNKIVFLTSAWTMIEWSRLFYFCGFPFNPVGLVLTFDPISMQGASIFGMYGLTFWTIFVAHLAAYEKIKSFAVCFVFPFVLSGAFIQAWKGEKTIGTPLDVALIQTGLKSGTKMGISRKRRREPFQIGSMEKDLFSIAANQKKTF